MNKYNAKEFLPLVQALADGKTIQHYCKDNGLWYDDTPCYFNLPPDSYRIKPEVREWYVLEDPTDGKIYHCSDEIINSEVGVPKNVRIVRVREILG